VKRAGGIIRGWLAARLARLRLMLAGRVVPEVTGPPAADGWSRWRDCPPPRTPGQRIEVWRDGWDWPTVWLRELVPPTHPTHDLYWRHAPSTPPGTWVKASRV
jgi:hypothetical protein